MRPAQPLSQFPHETAQSTSHDRAQEEANEQHRFGQVAAQWDLIHPQGSDEWNAMLEELLAHDVILDPTLTAYLASRDVMRARIAEWQEKYTLPSLCVQKWPRIQATQAPSVPLARRFAISSVSGQRSPSVR